MRRERGAGSTDRARVHARTVQLHARVRRGLDPERCCHTGHGTPPSPALSLGVAGDQ
jgi:hypothetical protein